MIISSSHYRIAIQFLIGIGIPIALAFSGWVISASIEKSKLDSEYVRIALSVLVNNKEVHEDVAKDSAKEKNLTEEDLPLRTWAVRLLNEKSPVRLSSEEQKAFIHGVKGLDIDIRVVPDKIQCKSMI